MASSMRTPRDLKVMIEQSHQEWGTSYKLTWEQIGDGETAPPLTSSSSPSVANSDKKGKNNEIVQNLLGFANADMSENAMLRSRIDEQSELICILKRRSDEHLASAQTLERVNAELRSFREDAAKQLEQEIRKFNILDDRFHELASNHEEMIKFKDEYKRQNEKLRKENERLRDENARLFNKAVEERDQRIAVLEEQVAGLNKQRGKMEEKCNSLTQELQQQETAHNTRLSALEKQLRQAQAKINELQSELSSVKQERQTVSKEVEERLKALSKERDELLDLSMQRGKIIQEKQKEAEKFQQKIDEAEKAKQAALAKFEREAAAVDANLQVQKLRQDLAEAQDRVETMVKEFDAFKKHTNSLLTKEKELNARLRHLVG
ncbi:CCDC89 [Branchiostoma lanceolatum]|uniref:CCDC89 protein n=1 Tax=Branchiostoma lanceolatum TaxID=7740 RepID=A0A8J9W6M6_BRALA|nr:CCDC89 [Branchiostoma lanceolatum]